MVCSARNLPPRIAIGEGESVIPIDGYRGDYSFDCIRKGTYDDDNDDDDDNDNDQNNPPENLFEKGLGRQVCRWTFTLLISTWIACAGNRLPVTRTQGGCVCTARSKWRQYIVYAMFVGRYSKWPGP